MPRPSKPVNLDRHKRNCTVCADEKREEIEAEFVAWESPAKIAKNYDLADRATLYRHAHAFGLFEKRKRNVRAALERIIEKVDDVEVTASAVVAAVQAYAKVNAQGQWIDRTDHVNVNELFEHMTQGEFEMYARDGTLPEWFMQKVAATPTNSREAKNDE